MVPTRVLVAGCILVLATGTYACHHDLTAPNSVPAAVDIVAGDGQSGTVGAELPQPLVARVVNSDGQGLPGQIVNFRVVKGSGSVFAGAAITNADGLAQDRWTLGKSVADSQVVEARAVDASSGAPLVFARFVATPLAGAPATLEKTGGDSQLAIVGSLLPESLFVRVSDVYGNVVSGASISWSVESGHGSVSRASGVTSAQGYASNTWTLGTDVGSQSVRAALGADLLAEFYANASMPPPLRLEKDEGDRQTAAPGSGVAVRPSVRVIDANGNVRAGIVVTFAVTGGGGSVTGASAVTDGAGFARVGSWVLGTQTGTNTLSATLANGGSVTFTATAAQISPDITLSIDSPIDGPVGDTVDTRVSVTSRLQISSVKVALAGRVVTLTAAGPGQWTGLVSLVGIPRDTMTLVATATDINGTAAQAIRTLFHDRKPRIIVTQPSDNGVARSTVDIDAGCDDDDPNGCTLSVRLGLYGGELVGPTPSPLRTSISLPGYDGLQVVLAITAKDSKGQLTTVTRQVWLESSQRLQLIGSAQGLLADALDTRLLWFSSTRDTVGVSQLSGGPSDTIVAGIPGGATLGYLTPTGAAFSAYLNVSPYARLYIWRNGSLATKDLSSTGSLAASGAYVIYTVPPLYRTDVTTGTEVVIATNSGNIQNSVSENGDVVYWNSTYDIVRYRGTTATPITSDGGVTRWNTYPVTDGINIVFRRHPPCCSAQNSEMEIWLFDGTSLSMLAPSRGADLSPGADYAVNGGWTAFTKADESFIVQVWTRSPSGLLRAVTAFGSNSTIRGIGNDGSVIFDNGRTDRYLAGPAGTPTRIASTLGSVVWRDGRFLILIGNSAFAVAP